MAAASGPLELDFLQSYARRDGDAVRLVLTLPKDADVPGRQVFVRFERHDAAVRAAAEVTRAAGRTRLEVAVPRHELPDGLWHLKLRQAGKPRRNLRARLLLHPDQPIALLFGKTSNIT
jgi:hypothetical protein